jgi:hypothetical protein
MALGNFGALREGLCFEIRAMRNGCPHCGTGVLAGRFVFTGLEFWSVWLGSVKATGEDARFTFGERRTRTIDEGSKAIEKLPPTCAGVHGVDSIETGYGPTWRGVDHQHAFG